MPTEGLAEAGPFLQVSDLEQAQAALAREPDAVLVTAPGLAAFAGAGFWRAVEVELGRSVVLDCGDDGGLVMAALRAGCRDILFTGRPDVAERLADMARQVGGGVRRAVPWPRRRDGSPLLPERPLDVRSAPV